MGRVKGRREGKRMYKKRWNEGKRRNGVREDGKMEREKEIEKK